MLNVSLFVIGASGVGKTALVSQFMTSEYMNTYDASLGSSVHSFVNGVENFTISSSAPKLLSTPLLFCCFLHVLSAY